MEIDSARLLHWNEFVVCISLALGRRGHNHHVLDHKYTRWLTSVEDALLHLTLLGAGILKGALQYEYLMRGEYGTGYPDPAQVGDMGDQCMLIHWSLGQSPRW